MKLSNCVLGIFFCVAFLPSVQARKNYLRVGKTTDLPSIGVKMKMPRNAVPKPMGSLSVKTLTARRGSKTKKMDTYFPEDLWIRDQLVGRYGSGNFMVSVFDMTLPPPADVQAIHKQEGHAYVLKENYDKWKENQKIDKWDEKNTIDWLKFLLGAKVSEKLEKMKRGGAKKATTYNLNVNSAQGDNYVYVIVPDKTPDKRFVIQFTLLSLDPKKSQKGIASCLASMAFYTPKKSKIDDKKITAGIKSKLKNKDWTPEYIASRERVINNIKNLKGWWYLETENFIMVANIKNKKTIRELHEGLEKSRSVYSSIFPIKEPLKAVSVAKSFETRKEYVEYVGKEYEWTGGLWMSDRKELVVSPMNWGSVRDRRDMMVEVIRHEGFHQYIYFATAEQNTSVWFNEGNATFFEGIKFKGKRPVIEGTKRMERAKKLAPTADVTSLINMSQQQFYSSPDRNYPLGYALMFFLHKGAPVMKKKNNYSEIPTKYYEAILKTKNPEKANQIAWEGVDMNQFNHDFQEFWSNKSLIKKAIRYDIIKAKMAKQKLGKF